MSNVNELRENLVDRVLELGVGEKFLEHPAFIPTLSEVSSLIGQMNISDPEKVYVSETDGVVSFEYTSEVGDKYSFELKAGENSISCVRVEEPHSFVGNSGSVVRQKNAIEIISKLDEYGHVTITKNIGGIDNIDCDNKHYNMSSSVETCMYDKDGVMYEREHKYYGARKGEGYFHRVGANELLNLARWIGYYGDKMPYSARTKLVRDTLDVATIVYHDRDRGHEYYGKVPLHQEHGLRDMYIANGYNFWPVPEVNIHPLMESEIEAMLARESDPRVAEGLRKYAEGRTTYRYSSNGDGQNTNSPKVM